MRRLLALTLLLTLWTGVASAQIGIPWPGPGGVAGAAPDCNTGSYKGPGDCLSGAVAWYGLRAYSTSAAASNLKAIQVLSTSHSGEACDILLATGGGLGVTANPGGGTCTDTGLALATFCTSNSDCTVKWLYDQSGNAHHIATAAVNGTLSISPLKLLLTTTQCYNTTTAGSAKVSIPQPATVSFVAQRTTVTSTFDMLFGFDGGVSETGFGASGSLSIYAGSAIANATETEGTQIATQSTFNGASSVEYVNGSSLGLSANPGSGSATAGDITVGCSEDLGHPVVANWWESGIWQGTAANHTNFPFSAMNTNQHSASNGWNF